MLGHRRAAPERGPRPRVLVVEDDQSLRSVIRLALELRDVTVVGDTGDGHVAVRLAEEHQPDLMVLNLGLTGLSGRDVFARLRDSAPSTRVVIFSGIARRRPDPLLDAATHYVPKEQGVRRLVDVLEGEMW